MPCRHPAEELLPVYDGTAVARADRRICALCGELVYGAPATRRIA